VSRTVESWKGKTDDSAVPPRVQIRVFEKYKGICQCGCGIKIGAGDKWETDHTVALTNGGTNDEANLRPLLAAHHKIKTKADVAEKSKVYRIKAKNLGVKKRKKKMAYRKFDGTVVPARWV
jgi:hypothetical protein